MPELPQISPQPGKRYALDGATLQGILDALVRRIVGGRGIQVRWYGNQVVIESTVRDGTYTPPKEGEDAPPPVAVYDSYDDMHQGYRLGSLGITKDLGNFYVRDPDGWRVLHPFRQATAPDGIGERDGDFWYDTDSHVLYVRLDGEWVPESHFAEPAEEP